VQVYPQMPALMGMLLMGVLLRNVPIDLAKGLPKMWAKEIRYGCLAIIFLASGLEQDIEVPPRSPLPPPASPLALIFLASGLE
jgi:hypothetical protein